MTDAPLSPERRAELEKQKRAQLLALGALALEMHQRGEIDGEMLSRAAAEIARDDEETGLA